VVASEHTVVVAAEPAVLSDAIVQLLWRAGVEDVQNSGRARPSGHFAVAIVTEDRSAEADADTVIVLPTAGATDHDVIDLTADVIDLVLAEQQRRLER
jgi:hypothetical protein